MTSILGHQGIMFGHGYVPPPPENVEFVGSSISTSTSATVSVTTPEEVQDGDLLILCHFNANHLRTVTSPPSGFSLVLEDSSTDNGFRIYSKIASSEPSGYSLTIDSGNPQSIGISSYRGATHVDAIGPLQRSNTGTALSVTATAPGALVAIFASEQSSIFSYSSPSSMQERAGISVPYSAMMIADDLSSPAGPSGNRVAVWSTSAGSPTILLQIA